MVKKICLLFMGLSLLMAVSTWAEVLEIPQDGTKQSGVSVVSGWKCEAGTITVRFDSGDPIPVVYGSTRADTIGECGDDNNGFVLLWNWNILGDGTHLVEVFADDILFGSAMVAVTTLGAEFLPGAGGTFLLNGFPSLGETVTIEWQEQSQNFVIAGFNDLPEVLGIFSETASERLMFDVDSFLGTFSGNGATVAISEDDSDRQEGNVSLAATVMADANLDGFAGWFVSWGTEAQAGNNSVVRDMSMFAGGRVIFWVKTPVDLEVGIRSGDVMAGMEESKVLLSDIDAAVEDNTWRQICLPLSMPGLAAQADLSQVKVFFVVASNDNSGGTGGDSVTFRIDDVRWESLPCPASS